jgi:hypothetical protein
LAYRDGTENLGPISLNRDDLAFNAKMGSAKARRTPPEMAASIEKSVKSLILLTEWRTQEDSNLWPLPSEGSALSS